MRTVLTSLIILWLSTPLWAANQPNILWLSAEDISPHLGCYGDPHAITPFLDSLAADGMCYTNAFTTAGVCAPNRSGMITGMYQTTLGTQHMRCQAKLPSHIKPFTTYLRKAGYYCTSNSKTDYQFSTPKDAWNESSGKAHWKNRPHNDQPFFAVFNFTGCHESGIASTNKYHSVTKNLSLQERQFPNKLTTFPPYYPRTPAALEDWKRNYELITALDHWCKDHVETLKAAGLYDNTIIFFWSDHGVGLPRAKRWLYDSGTHIPLIVHLPEKFQHLTNLKPGNTTDRLVSSIDLGPTVLNLAQAKIPAHIQGQAFLGLNQPPAREYVYGARDRMDERYDIIRMVRDKRFKYIRNYEPLKTYYQYMNTPEKGATMTDLRNLHEAGMLNTSAEYYFSKNKPVEELYDTQHDPHELHNLADNKEHQLTLMRLRQVHIQWVQNTKDLGLIAEPILIERQAELGNQYDILRKTEDTTLVKRISETALLASEGATAKRKLVAALQDNDSAVRYWAATGLGNIGKPAADIAAQLEVMLQEEPSSVVRTAAARALCMFDLCEFALPTLIHELNNGAQWERLHAAIVLDQIDRQALPVVREMHQALKPRTDLYANGKYVVRVINRALNQLENTQRTVP
ncbi:MAG: sulfatase [Planctomycetaceae bacterium]|nr:sulfatase [Planctomycetaceae bacterium]